MGATTVNKAGLFAVVGGLVVVGLVAAIATRPKQLETPPEPTKPKKPTKPAKPSSPGVPGKETKGDTLTSEETVSLANDPTDLLAAWGMVSPHKVYVKAIADKLAAAGDTRSADINARIANWAGPVVYAGFIDPEASMVANPGNFTLDQIGEVGLGSDFPAFKQWAAQFMKANQREETAQLILDQIAANAAAGGAGA